MMISPHISAAALLFFAPSIFAGGATQIQQEAPAKKIGKPARNEPQPPDPDKELDRALEEAGNDFAAQVRNLENYLKRFPDAPKKAAVYRALAEAALQLRDKPKAIDYAERLIAIRPEDAGMMLFAAGLLEQQGDAQSLTRAVGYASRVLDRIEKEPQAEKPVRVSREDWELEHKKLRMSVHLLRGRIEMKQKNYDAAAADLEKCYELVPNTPAALRLGELAEIRKQPEKAIEHYADAFVLPDSYGTLADQLEARRKLGNLWRQTHGSEAGLGDYLLAAYDRVTSDPANRAQAPRNEGVEDPLAMQVRRLSGEPLKLAEAKGKVVVLYFWATWCGPCRELEPLVEAVYEKYEKQPGVVFLAVNRDEDELLVAPYVEKEKIKVPIVFSDGLERALRVESIPTVIVFDRAGAITYRAQGSEAEGFVAALTAAIEHALSAPPAN